MKDTRTQILRVAARLFAQKGFPGTSVRDIVSAAGENVSAIKYHFGSKQKLYQATLEYLLDSFHQHLWGQEKAFLSLTEPTNGFYYINRCLSLLRTT